MYRRFYICHNDNESIILKIRYIDICPPIYLKNMYHLIMRLDYEPEKEGHFDDSTITENCFKQVVNELGIGNFLQQDHAVYIVDYTYIGLDEEMDSFAQFASSVNSSLTVDVHEINIFSPALTDNSQYSSSSSSSVSSVSSVSSASSSIMSSLRESASSAVASDSVTEMSFEHLNEE